MRLAECGKSDGRIGCRWRVPHRQRVRRMCILAGGCEMLAQLRLSHLRLCPRLMVSAWQIAAT
jgi:hypothetical protein